MKRLYILWLACFCMPAAAAQSDFRLQLPRSLTFDELFHLIEAQTSYTVAFKHSDIPREATLTVRQPETGLREALEALLPPYGLDFHIRRGRIFIEQRRLSAEGIRGTVRTEGTLSPIPYANVRLVSRSDGRIRQSQADSLGRFGFRHLPIGRYVLQGTALGHASGRSEDLLTSSVRETVADLLLPEVATRLGEIVLTADNSPEMPANPMSLSGGRLLSTEKTSRHAGSFDDPARLVTSFAGVASAGVNSNALEVRGNAPQFTQWRMEGIETPNLTHFADMTGLGGGVLTALSTEVLGNSDFYYGVYPAEYTNALAGVFDMKMREGNDRNHTHSFQVGVWGLDASSEGPVSRKQGSSYLLNYRYSYSALADRISGNDEGMDYQDLAFKVKLPTRRAGTFTLWGAGLLDKHRTSPEEDPGQWETINDRQETETRFEKGAAGITHHLPLDASAYLQTHAGITYSGTHAEARQYTSTLSLLPVALASKHETTLQLNSCLTRRFSDRHTNRTGFTFTEMLYELDFNTSPEPGLEKPMQQYARGRGTSYAFTAFTQSRVRLNARWQVNVGLNANYFRLNRAWSVEPRADIVWQPTPRQTLSLGYGLSSRRERIEYYYTGLPGSLPVDNSHLRPAKTHQLALSYTGRPGRGMTLRVEPYFQYLLDVPVEEGTSFSIINFNGFILDRELVNRGRGRNYGVDISLERSFHRGWYAQVSGSLFRSEYTGGDGIWRNSRMDRRFMFKALGGREWISGKKQNKVLGVNLRLTWTGGERHTPFDLQASDKTHDLQTDDTRAYTRHLPASLVTDLTVNYRINSRKVSHEFSFQILNLNGFRGTGYEYNLLTNSIEKVREASIVPNLRYRIYF